MDDKPQENISVDFLQNLQVDGMLKDNFTKKCVVDDFNKTVLQSYNSKSDFFILDFSEARYGIINITSADGKRHYFTATGRITKRNKEGKCFLDLLEGEKEIESFEVFDTPYNIQKTCELLVDWLINKMGYAESEIILVESKGALTYTDGKMLYDFPNKKRIVQENNYIEKWNDEIRRLLPNCNWINLPDVYIGDTRNKWGKYPFHYCREVYDYFYEAINIIVQGGDLNSREYYRNRCAALVKEKIAFYNINKEYEQMLISQDRNSRGLEIAKKGLEAIQTCKISEVNSFIESLKKKIEKQLSSPYLVCDYHVRKEGWLQKKGSKIVCRGNETKNIWLEAIKISVFPSDEIHINYAVKLKKCPNFTDIYSDGKMSGTTGKSMPIDGIKIWLTGEAAQNYGISYQIKGENDQKEGKDGEEVFLDNDVIKEIEMEITLESI